MLVNGLSAIIDYSCDYSIAIIAYGTRQKFNQFKNSNVEKSQSALDPTKKCIFFRFRLQYYYDAWDFEKKESHWTLTEKKNCFWLQYYCDAQDLEKFQSTHDPTEKIIVSSFCTIPFPVIFYKNETQFYMNETEIYKVLNSFLQI